MACCLMAPSHYLYQWWFVIPKVLQHSSEDNFTSRLPLRCIKKLNVKLEPCDLPGSMSYFWGILNTICWRNLTMLWRDWTVLPTPLYVTKLHWVQVEALCIPRQYPKSDLVAKELMPWAKTCGASCMKQWVNYASPTGPWFTKQWDVKGLDAH